MHQAEASGLTHSVPGETNEFSTALSFPLFNVAKNCVQVIVEAGRVRIAHTTDFVDDGIIHGSAPKSSSGVQMIGALKPLAVQAASIIGRIVAFAR